MILLPVITLVLIFCVYLKKKRKRLDIVSLLILTYVVMGGASLVLEMTGLFPNIFPIAFEPMAYLSVCFCIVFWGFTGFNNQRLTAIKIENLFLYRAMEFFLLIGGVLAIIFFLPYAMIALTGDVAENRQNVVFAGTALGEWGIVNSFFSLLANLFLLAQVCAFINLIPRAGITNTKRAYLLLISSLSYVVYVLAYVGRDGIVYWIMSYLFCFLLFRDFIAREELKRLNRFVVLISIPLLLVFMLISISRFSESTGGIGWQILRYAGQQIGNFNDHYQIEAPLTHGRLVFPEFIKFMDYVGIDVGPNIDNQILHSYFLDEGVQPWVFTTYIGLLMIDIGKIGVLVYLFLMSFITRKILRKVSTTGVFEFSNLVLFVLLFQIVYWGVFYFRQCSANYYMLCMVLLFVLFKVSKISRPSSLFIKAALK